MLLSNIRNSVRSCVAEPTAGRFFENSEIDGWINEELIKLSKELKFLKRSTTILGSAYVTDLGTDVLYYELPADLISIDHNAGIKVNGVRRLPSTQFQQDSFQERQLSGASLNGSTTVLYPEDYFSANFSGVVFHYVLDYVFSDEITDLRSGKLCWFLSNPAATDSIVITYIASHPTLVDDTDDSRIGTTFDELVYVGAAIRASYKMLAAGFIGTNFVQMLEAKYKALYDVAVKHFRDDLKSDRTTHNILNASRKYNLYNSSSRNRSQYPYSC